MQPVSFGPNTCLNLTDVRQLSSHPGNRPNPSLEPQVSRPFINQSQTSPRPRPKSSFFTPSQGVAANRQRGSNNRQMARAVSNNSLDRAATRGTRDEQLTFDPGMGTLASQDLSTCVSTPHLNRIGDGDRAATAARTEREERRRGRPKSSISPRSSYNVPVVTISKRAMPRPKTSNVMSYGRSLSNVRASSYCDISQSEADWSIIDAMLDDTVPEQYGKHFLNMCLKCSLCLSITHIA